MKMLFTNTSSFYCATNDVCMKINSLLLIEATLWCFIRVEDIIKINSTYNIIQSLVLSFTQLCIFIPLSLFFILLCLPMAFFPLCFSSIPFCILPSKYASTKEKNVSGISKKMPAALLQWNYYYLSWPNAGFPPPLTYFPPFKTEVFLFLSLPTSLQGVVKASSSQV